MFFIGFIIGSLIFFLLLLQEKNKHLITKAKLNIVSKQKDLYFKKMKLWEKLFKQKYK